MGFYDTEYKNLSYKELIILLENIKPKLINSFSEDFYVNSFSETLNNFYEYKNTFRTILQEIHNKVCLEMSEKLGFKIEPTNISCNNIVDVDRISRSNGSIDFGEYDFSDEIIGINPLVNFPKNCKNYQIEKYNTFWTLEMLNTVFHETMHYIQQRCVSTYSKLNEQSLNIKNYTTANFYCDYETTDIRHKYLNEIIELDARKFAIDSILLLEKNNQLPFSCKEYINEKFIIENDAIGNNFEHLKFAQNKYKVKALQRSSFGEEDHTNTINNFYKNMFEYYQQIRDNCSNLTEENKKMLPKIEFINKLSDKEIHILCKDYLNYKNSKNKKEFLEQISLYNSKFENNEKLLKFSSKLPEFLKELENNNSKEL